MMKRYLPRGAAPSLETAFKGLISRPVFGLDIDGTLGEYHAHFLRFAAGWLGKEVWPGPLALRGKGVAWTHEDYHGDCSLAQYMGVSKETYRRVKLAYRQGGLKRSMPAFPWAADLTRALRARGAEVWVCTTRPYLQVSGVEEDTRIWLRRNGVQADGVIAGEHKYRTLASLFKNNLYRVVAVVDDLEEMCGQADQVGIRPVMLARPHNRALENPWDWAQPDGSLLNVLMRMLEEWEDRYR